MGTSMIKIMKQRGDREQPLHGRYATIVLAISENKVVAVI